jgi:transposase
MRFVALKTVEQFDLQALHRIRERLASQRTSVINQIRASCANVASPCDKAFASWAPEPPERGRSSIR